MNRVLAKLLSLPSFAAILLVWCYQWLISPWLGPTCRFQPTCSAYMIASLRKHGLLVGGCRGLRRMSRCHPWGGSGYDPP